MFGNLNRVLFIFYKIIHNLYRLNARKRKVNSGAWCYLLAILLTLILLLIYEPRSASTLSLKLKLFLLIKL